MSDEILSQQSSQPSSNLANKHNSTKKLQTKERFMEPQLPEQGVLQRQLPPVLGKSNHTQTALEKLFVEKIMKQQKLILSEKSKQILPKKPDQQLLIKEGEQNLDTLNQYIDNKVDYHQSISEQSHDKSWQEECSESENDFDPYYDEEEDTDTNDIMKLKQAFDDPISIKQIFNDKEEVFNSPKLEITIDQQPGEQNLTGQLVINVAQTKYDVVKKVAKKICNWRLTYSHEDENGAIFKGQRGLKLSPVFDLSWHDLAITPDYLSKLYPYQKVNMYPGIQCISKKHNLARNLMRMYKAFPNEYNFFPKTWVLPHQTTDLRNHCTHNASISQKKQVTYIVKPDSLCQGKGIFLSRKIDVILEKTKINELSGDYQVESERMGYVVQQYIDMPHLIDGLKYDLRLYVFLYGLNPLRIFLHQMAFARFCTEQYKKPTKGNMDNIFMHLTNYAVNKGSERYEEAEDEEGDAGHKRSFGSILKILGTQGCNVDQLLSQIKDIIVKTIITGQPCLNFNYKISQPDCLDNSMAFQILGFDILIDSEFKPYLLEVNCSPSFGTDSPLDYKIKKSVISDAFQMLNLSYAKRIELIRQYQERLQERILTGKTIKLSQAQREYLKQSKLAERYHFESTRMGGYELIYPSNDKQKNDNYEEYIKKSTEIWDEFYVGKNKGKKFELQYSFINKKPQQRPDIKDNKQTIGAETRNINNLAPIVPKQQENIDQLVQEESQQKRSELNLKRLTIENSSSPKNQRILQQSRVNEIHQKCQIQSIIFPNASQISSVSIPSPNNILSSHQNQLISITQERQNQQQNILTALVTQQQQNRLRPQMNPPMRLRHELNTLSPSTKQYQHFLINDSPLQEVTIRNSFSKKIISPDADESPTKIKAKLIDHINRQYHMQNNIAQPPLVISSKTFTNEERVVHQSRNQLLPISLNQGIQSMFDSKESFSDLLQKNQVQSQPVTKHQRKESSLKNPLSCYTSAQDFLPTVTHKLNDIVQQNELKNDKMTIKSNQERGRNGATSMPAKDLVLQIVKLAPKPHFQDKYLPVMKQSCVAYTPTVLVKQKKSRKRDSIKYEQNQLAKQQSRMFEQPVEQVQQNKEEEFQKEVNVVINQKINNSFQNKVFYTKSPISARVQNILMRNEKRVFTKKDSLEMQGVFSRKGRNRNDDLFTSTFDNTISKINQTYNTANGLDISRITEQQQTIKVNYHSDRYQRDLDGLIMMRAERLIRSQVGSSATNQDSK